MKTISYQFKLIRKVKTTLLLFVTSLPPYVLLSFWKFPLIGRTKQTTLVTMFSGKKLTMKHN